MNKHPIKAILFDLDDTLWPIVPVIAHAETTLHEWLMLHAPAVTRQFSIDHLRERRMALMATDPRYQIDLHGLRHAMLTEVFSITGEDPAKIETAMTVFTEARNTVTLFEDVLPVLEQLNGKVALGSVSNGLADLQAIGLAHYFHTSIAAYSFGSAKPDAAIFHAACDALHVTPAEAVYVGDDPMLDVEGAQKAGLRSIWMNRIEHQPRRMLPEHIRPDAICTTFHELHQWLGERIIIPPSHAARIE